MTRAERTAQYLHSLFGVNNVVSTLVRSGFNQALDRPGEWGRGGRGFGYRLGSGYSQGAISSTFEAGIALGLGEDNRYFRSRGSGFGHRLRYAVESTFLARHNDGSRSVSFSAAGGPMAGALISRFWQPESASSAANGFYSFGISIAVRAGMNVAREFAPGFVRSRLP